MKTENNQAKIKLLSQIFLFSIIVSAAVFLLSSALVTAAISCPGCQVGSCTCIVGACSSGIFLVYNSSGCSGVPTFQYTFSGRNVPFSPDTATQYYVQAFCDDGQSAERCTSIFVGSQGSTETTSSTEQTTGSTGTGGGGGGGGGFDTTWLILAIIIVLAVIVFVIYRLFFTKKKGKSGKTYEELYRKWGGRPRQF